jgi:DNA-binding response OmpR family regulator
MTVEDAGGQMRILLVEDDCRFATALTAALRRGGYEIDHVTTAAAAVAAPVGDLVLLDLMLPDGDGVAVCRAIRERSDVPIIVLSARGTERDRVIALRSGADDYLVKPFGIAELHARAEAVLRRARPRPAGVRVVGRLRVDLDQHRAYVDSTPIMLTRKEFHVLAILTAQPGAVVRRDRLVAEVWHTSWLGSSRTVDVHIATLRAKLGDAARLQTVRGVGFRLDAEPAADSVAAAEG